MSWMQLTPSRAASVTRGFTETLAFTLASQQRIQTTLTSVSTSDLQLNSYTKPWRAKMVKWHSLFKPYVVCCRHLTRTLHVFQEKCWCIASWEWVDQLRWSWRTWCCGSTSLWRMLWGMLSKNDLFIPTGTSCPSYLNWMNSWHEKGGCVLFSDLFLSAPSNTEIGILHLYL